MRKVAVLLLALWVPVTMHCALEAVPGLEFLQSCCEEKAAPVPGTDCSEDGCAQVENGLYPGDDRPCFTLDPLQLPLGMVPPVLVVLGPPPGRPGMTGPAGPPPELCCGWQFDYRMARPPRAPTPRA